MAARKKKPKIEVGHDERARGVSVSGLKMRSSDERPCMISFLCDDCNAEHHVLYPLAKAPLRVITCSVCGEGWERAPQSVAQDTVST
jgi:hypothetical protein